MSPPEAGYAISVERDPTDTNDPHREEDERMPGETYDADDRSRVVTEDDGSEPGFPVGDVFRSGS